MLVLSRRKTESIMIGENMEIVIADVRGDIVRVGIIAPKSVPVHRKEVYQAIRKERALSTAEAYSFFTETTDTPADGEKIFTHHTGRVHKYG